MGLSGTIYQHIPIFPMISQQSAPPSPSRRPDCAAAFPRPTAEAPAAAARAVPCAPGAPP